MDWDVYRITIKRWINIESLNEKLMFWKDYVINYTVLMLPPSNTNF
jgi:hypothetical protein